MFVKIKLHKADRFIGVISFPKDVNLALNDACGVSEVAIQFIFKTGHNYGHICRLSESVLLCGTHAFIHSYQVMFGCN